MNITFHGKYKCSFSGYCSYFSWLVLILKRLFGVGRLMNIKWVSLFVVDGRATQKNIDRCVLSTIFFFVLRYSNCPLRYGADVFSPATYKHRLWGFTEIRKQESPRHSCLYPPPFPSVTPHSLLRMEYNFNDVTLLSYVSISDSWLIRCSK
jgi:hypothetical protein